MSFWSKIVLLMLTAVQIVIAQAHSNSPSTTNDKLRTFLQHYLGAPYPPFEKEWPTQYSSVAVDLKDDGTNETIVYLSGRGWCGTGGCSMLILVSEGASYRVITRTTITRLPIRVLSTKTNDWHDIGVTVGGGGIPLHVAALSFDGKTYPRNPSDAPARQLDEEVPGRTVIDESVRAQQVY